MCQSFGNIFLASLCLTTFSASFFPSRARTKAKISIFVVDVKLNMQFFFVSKPVSDHEVHTKKKCRKAQKIFFCFGWFCMKFHYFEVDSCLRLNVILIHNRSRLNAEIFFLFTFDILQRQAGLLKTCKVTHKLWFLVFLFFRLLWE